MNKDIKKLINSAKRVKTLDFKKPMLARLTKDYFSSPDWIYERKLDGERVLAIKKDKQVKLYSRNKKNITKTYPEIRKSLEELKAKNFIIDGEVVAFSGNKTSFSKLQKRFKKESPDAKALKIKVYYYLFDILHYLDRDLSKLELVNRKKILKEIIDFKDPLRFCPHRNQEGKKYHNLACKKGWEGIIAKDKHSKYSQGRSSDWLKFKCFNEDEYIIIGYSPAQGSRIGFGALLLGYYQANKLKYAGKVGTGFDDQTLKDLKSKLEKIKVNKKITADKVPGSNNQFVKPHLVAQIAYTEKTSSHKLRHPRYLGLRRDKRPKQVKY
ncbi:MAG: non-homologous end-joining DNA ligase [Parcubacteria group bacterium]